MLRLTFTLLAAGVFASSAFAQTDGFEREPINYKSAEANNVITAASEENQREADKTQVRG